MVAKRTYDMPRVDIDLAYITTSHVTTANITLANIVDASITNTATNTLSVSQQIAIKEQASTPAPVASFGKLYCKTDGNPYFLNDSGVEFRLNLSNIEYSTTNWFGIGGVGISYPTLRPCTINGTTGVISNASSGPDLMLNSVADQTPDQSIIAARIWNAVWNDVADFQDLYPGEIRPQFGKCYFDTFEGAQVCDRRCQKSVIGIASDTFGFGVGSKAELTVPIAVAGWTLAYIEFDSGEIYECGDVLTNNYNGNLIKMTDEEKMKYPERIVAIYKKPEPNELWGPEGKEIQVNGRHWVKVK